MKKLNLLFSTLIALLVFTACEKDNEALSDTSSNIDKIDNSASISSSKSSGFITNENASSIIDLLTSNNGAAWNIVSFNGDTTLLEGTSLSFELSQFSATGLDVDVTLTNDNGTVNGGRMNIPAFFSDINSPAQLISFIQVAEVSPYLSGLFNVSSQSNESKLILSGIFGGQEIILERS
ncbi:hypothetical protein A8C32_08245 [Flavivirga aquatica]|uniref:DUF306 domain-containing protein n=1 Tax=Flavivirga aquatica TaxID=1849968 RepID=A0A1E5SJ59_9FLAO|nr:hypothetical protein [Flavivirga aquatica]OEJ99154.1 hypothetical protein A8C32_08245 [Flavivirga aquatica]